MIDAAEKEIEHLLLEMYGPEVLKNYQSAKRNCASMMKDEGFIDGFLVGKVSDEV